MLCIEPAVLPPPCQPFLNLQSRSLGWTCTTWRPEFPLTLPETVDELYRDKRNLIFSHGVTIVKFLPEVAAKISALVNLLEAKIILYVRQNTMEIFTIPIYLWVLLMATHSIRRGTRAMSLLKPVSIQVTGYIQEMRDLASDGYIGSLGQGPEFWNRIMLNIPCIVSWWKSHWFSGNCLFYIRRTKYNFNPWELIVKGL